jgi:hypothetical protein
MPPVGYTPNLPLPRGPGGGYLDRFGNEWQIGEPHGLAFTSGHPKEWDVQLSTKGQTVWSRYAKKSASGGWYINVTRDGRLSH